VAFAAPTKAMRLEERSIHEDGKRAVPDRPWTKGEMLVNEVLTDLQLPTGP